MAFLGNRLSLFLSRGPMNRRREKKRERIKIQRKTTIMEVNYGGMIAKIGKIIGNKKKSIGNPIFSLPPTPPTSFFIFYVFFGCQATVTPKGIEASFNYKNSAVPCSLIPLPTLFMLYVLSNRRVILPKIFLLLLRARKVFRCFPFFYE